MKLLLPERALANIMLCAILRDLITALNKQYLPKTLSLFIYRTSNGEENDSFQYCKPQIDSIFLPVVGSANFETNKKELNNILKLNQNNKI